MSSNPVYNAVKGYWNCEQYRCINNSCGYCNINEPKLYDFGDGTWGCENEEYKGDIKIEN